MPKIVEERRCGPAEESFPQPKSRQQPQIVAHSQIAPADAEEGKEPSQKQLSADKHLAQPGQPGAQGPEKIHSRSQGHSAQKAAQEPLPDQPRRHRRSPRLRRGSM